MNLTPPPPRQPTKVPDAVCSELGPVVKVLDASGAALAALPQDIGRLTNLTRLALVSRRAPEARGAAFWVALEATLAEPASAEARLLRRPSPPPVWQADRARVTAADAA